MLERSFKETRSRLALQAVKAIEDSDHAKIHLIGEILPVLNQAQETVFATLGEFGDVPLPETPDTPQTASEPEQFVAVVTHLHEGFADAQDVLLKNIQTAIARGDTQAAEYALEHTLRVANAWKDVENTFAKPEIQQTLTLLTPAETPKRRNRPAITAWERLGSILLEPSQLPAKVAEPVIRESLWADLARESKRFQGRTSHDVLRQMRLDQNMTQGEIAKKAGEKSVSYVSAVERGQINPSLPAAMEIIAATGNDPRKNLLPFVWLMKVYEETIYGKPL